MSDALYLIQVIIILIPSSMAARNILQSPVASPHHVTSTKTTTSFPSAATANSQVRWPIRTCFSFAKKENSRAPSSTPARSSSGEVKPLSGVHYDTTESIKGALYRAVEGIDRGIFGATLEKKSEVEGLVELLESQNPNPCPTDHLTQVDGCWKLVYSTISILGSKRTKLGLRYLVTLGDFLQTIDVAQGKATNEIKFNVGGLKMFSGQLTIVASYTIATKTRVDIKFENSDISPSQLMDLFQKNHHLLLAIFNPDGWLEITYVDESFRIGRDDKGNIFILERFIQASAQPRTPANWYEEPTHGLKN